MDPSTNLNFPKLENPPDFGCCFNFEVEDINPFGIVSDLPSFEVESGFDFNFPTLPLGNNCYIEFKDFEDISSDFALSHQNGTTVPAMHEDVVVDAKPLKTLVGNSFGHYYDNTTNVGSFETISSTIIPREYGASTDQHGGRRRISRRKKTAPLELHEIKRYFDFPITQAAKEMKVGLTVLKKRCRELNIMRWPHRKIKSLKSLIDNVKELGLSNEIMMLEEHQRMLENLPDAELTERTKKLRQACFKANYKKRRSLAAACGLPW